MSSALTPVQQQQFEENGTLFPIPVLSEAEVAYYRDQIAEFEAAFEGKIPPTLMGETHFNFPWAYKLATHPRILDVAEGLLGPDLLIHSTTIFHKRAGEGSFASWHQDGYFMELSEPGFITIWVALTSSKPENGCVCVLPATQTLGKLPHSTTAVSDQNLLGSGLQVTHPIEAAASVDIVLNPGELSVHHIYAIHGSNPNHSDQDRIGFVIKIVAPKVKQAFPHCEVVLARGRDEYGYWKHFQQPPTSEFSAALPAHIRFTEELKNARIALGRKNG